MSPNWSRRDALRAGSAGAVSLLAGCSLLEGAGTPPATLRSQYGIVARNEYDEPQEVRIEVQRPFEGEVQLDETVELAPDESREWDGVLADQGKHAVTANLLSPIERTDDDYRRLRDFEREALSWDTVWIIPGSDTAPAVEDIQVVVTTDEVDPPRSEPSYGNNVDITWEDAPTEDPEVTETDLFA